MAAPPAGPPPSSVSRAPLLAPQGHSGTRPPDIVTGRIVAEIEYAGPARKVSVSMPEGLTAAVLVEEAGRPKTQRIVVVRV